jgi:hypothetical protein
MNRARILSVEGILRVLGPGLLVLGGCMNTGTALPEPDPMVGGVPINRMGLPTSRAASDTGGGLSTATGQVPPVPSPYAPTSPAGLAGNGTGVDGPAPTVRMGAPRPTVTENRITPVAASGTSTGAPVTAAAAVLPGEYSFEQLQAMLAARGVSMQKLETVSDRGEWRFSCAIPNRQVPNVRRNYSAQAAGPYGLAAMRAVIDRIDQEQGAR